MNLRFVKSLTPLGTEESGSYTAKDASTWAMLLGILQTGRGRHTIAVIQIDRVDFQIHALMDATDVVTKENSLSNERRQWFLLFC